MGDSQSTPIAKRSAPGTARGRVLLALHVVLLVALCFAVYSNGYEHAFLLDSLHTVFSNPSVRSLANVPAFFVDASTFSTLPSNTDYRPVLQATYALNHAMGGYTMWWWHFTQIALHAACVIGLYQLCKRVARLAGVEASDDLRVWIAFAAAAVFALEPTGSGVVNYLSARSSLLTAAFLFPAILLYMDTGTDEAARPARWRLWASFALYTLALFTKIEAVACLAVFFLWEVWRVSREKGSRFGFFGDVVRAVDERTLRRLAPFVAATAGYYLLRIHALSGFEYAEASKSLAASKAEYAMTQTVALWYYVGHWFAPFGLVADHASFTIRRSMLDPEVLLAVGAWVVLATAAIAQWRRRPYFAFLAASALALISPTSSIVPLAEMVNEHRPYMPLAVLSLCWMIPLGLIARRLVQAPLARFGLSAGALSILCALALATYQRNEVFLTRVGYWEDVLAKAPSGRAHTNLGRVFMSNSDYRTAREHFEKALALTPYWHVAHINLAIVLRELGYPAQAEEHFDRAVDYDQFSGTAYTWRGDHRTRTGRYAEALEDFLSSRERGQNDYFVHKGFATAYAGLGDAEKSFEHLEICLDLEPQKTQMELATIVKPFFDDAARTEAGLAFLEKLEGRLPDGGEQYKWRGDQSLENGRYAEALAYFLASQERGENDYLVHKGLATAYAGLGDAEKSFAELEVCLQLEFQQAQLDIVKIVNPYFEDAARNEAGLVFFQNLAERLPDAWWVHHNLGTLAQRLGKTDLAQSELRLSVELKPR